MNYKQIFTSKRYNSLGPTDTVYGFQERAGRESENGFVEGVWVRTKEVQLYIIQKITMNNRSLSCS